MLEQIFWVNNAIDKVQIFRGKILAILHDDYVTNIKLNFVILLLVFKEIEERAFGNKQHGTEFQLSFYAEMLRWNPQWFSLVKLFIISVFLLDSLSFLLIRIFPVSIIIYSSILNLRSVFLNLFLFFHIFIIGNFNRALWDSLQSDRIPDDMRIFIYNLLDTGFFNIFDPP